MPEPEGPVTLQQIRPLMGEELAPMRLDIAAMRGDLSGLGAELATMRVDMGAIRKDVHTLGDGLGGLRQDVSELRHEIAVLKTEFEGRLGREADKLERRARQMLEIFETNLLRSMNAMSEQGGTGRGLGSYFGSALDETRGYWASAPIKD